MTPRLEACYFGTGEQGCKYSRLARVLEDSARQHCVGWEIDVRRLHPPEYVSACGNISHVWNTQKLEHWRTRVQDAPDGAQVLLIDGDIMLLRPLDDAWALSFDLAYTVREGGRLPLNGGVVFVRVSGRTRAFMAAWWETNVRFLGNAREHAPWRTRYAGINQASFGYLLERVHHGCALRKLPCSEWNCCEWERFDAARTRVVHIKSGLRRQLFAARPREDSPLAGYRLPGPASRSRQASISRLIDLWSREELRIFKARSREARRAAANAV